MNFLLSTAINNSAQANQYKSILTLFKTLSKSLNELGHNTFIIADRELEHSDDEIENMSFFDYVNEETFSAFLKEYDFNPDYCFIWNGNVDTDIEFIKLMEKFSIKPIFGELGFFEHYNKTCYFDINGVNCKISDLTKDYNKISNFSRKEFEMFKEKMVKPRLHKGNYIFIPLQSESDTQIKTYSPFKTMDEFLGYVDLLLKNDDRPILIKQHPMSESEITMRDKFQLVDDDIYHYIPYADLVIGINSTVLVETLLFHSRILSVGLGVSSRGFKDDYERERFIFGLYKKQLKWEDLKDAEKVQDILEGMNL